MLQNLSQQVRDCLKHAEDCALQAKVQPDPNLQRDYLMMERRWLSLARSYQFSEHLDTFSRHNNNRLKEADEALNRLTELAERMVKNSP
jgi:hypothetical protein